MNFDVFTISAVVDELNEKLLGGKVQDTLEIGADAVGLEIYFNHQRNYLLVSADPQMARLQLVDDKLRRGVETPSPLGLMLRRYVETGRIEAIRQPPYERVVEIMFNGPEGAFTLISEPMERRANILLVRDGIIMDCLRRVGPQDNRVRLSLPGHAYMPPPPQITKRDPATVTGAQLAETLASDPTRPAYRALTDTLLGLSPMLAKEIIYRAVGRADAKSNVVNAGDLFEVFSEVLTPLLAHQWQPGITGGRDGSITGFSVYEVTFMEGWRPYESISGALSAFYGAPIGIEAYDAAKEPTFAILDEARDKIQRKLDALHRSERDESERERLRMSGELLLAYQYQIVPKQTTFSAQYDYDQPPLDIKLDPTLSALDNAKRYFSEYEHAKRAMAEIPGLIRTAQIELDYLDQLRSDLTLAANWPEMGEVQDALEKGGYWQGPKPSRAKGTKSAPIRVMTDEGTLIWVGRNARQNEDVTFTKGRPEDLWMHARGVPGAHVIVKSAGRAIKPADLQRAASLAAYYSASRSEGHVLVDVTERRHVHKLKGGKPGMVTYRGESPIDATPRPE